MSVAYGLRTSTITALIDGKTQCIYRIEGVRGGSFEQVVKRFHSGRRPATGIRTRIWVGRLPSREGEWESAEGWLTSIKRPNRTSQHYQLTGILQCADSRTGKMVLVRFRSTYSTSEEVRAGIIRPQKDDLI